MSHSNGESSQKRRVFSEQFKQDAGASAWASIDSKRCYFFGCNRLIRRDYVSEFRSSQRGVQKPSLT